MPQVAFTVLLGLTLASLVWLHAAVTTLSRSAARQRAIERRQGGRAVNASLQS
jgi:hypothetical protein